MKNFIILLICLGLLTGCSSDKWHYIGTSTDPILTGYRVYINNDLIKNNNHEITTFVKYVEVLHILHGWTKLDLTDKAAALLYYVLFGDKGSTEEVDLIKINCNTFTYTDIHETFYDNIRRLFGNNTLIKVSDYDMGTTIHPDYGSDEAKIIMYACKQ